MSETDRSVESAPPGNPTGGASSEKRDWAARVLSEILQRMGVAAKLDLKDAADGGISIAVQLEGDLPGVQPGKRSHVVEALQFLANKIVNRPGADRRWISIGIGNHPEPRSREGRRHLEPSAAIPQSSTAVPRPTPLPPARAANGRLQASASAPKPADEDEASVETTEDAQLSAAARSMAEKASSLGRFLAIVGMKREDRARVLRAAKGTEGVKVAAEGIGRNRRVVFIPDNPAPMMKGSLPTEEEEDLGS